MEHFFKTAEVIVRGDMISNGTIAMAFVTKGCSEPSDIITKKTEFYSALERHNIVCDAKEYFNNENNNKYCVQSDFEPMLSLINILRKGESNKAIQNIGYFLITGTRNTLSQAYSLIQKDDKSLKTNNSDRNKITEKPLAKSLEDITKLFWFALNKSFGHSHKLTSFDVIHKAKIVLSSILNGKIKDNYEKLNQEFKKKNLTKDAVANCIDELRNRLILPENIQSDGVDSVLTLIETSDIEHIQNEKKMQQNQLHKTEMEKLRIEHESAKKDERIAELEKKIKDEENRKREQAHKNLVKKQNRKNKTIMFVKIGCFLALIGGIIFLTQKYIIPCIPAESKWFNVTSYICSIITIIGLSITIVKKFIITPYKENNKKINMTEDNTHNSFEN